MVTHVDTDRPLIIAIDGPSGSGKSSTSRGVADRLGLAYLDTGAMYRAGAWLMLARDLTDPADIVEAVRTAPMTISLDPNAFTISIDGTEVTEAIREPRISESVSTVATIQAVRDILIARQRDLIESAAGGIVVEGRDITTVVAPDARLRILLVADPAARVARRSAEIGEKASADEIADQVIRRDRDDSTVAAFTDAAPGVTVVDSTNRSLSEVIDHICHLAERID